MAMVTGRSGRFCALLVALLASFATMPLLQPHFIASSDGLFHLYRLMEYDAVLRDGVWHPRWAPDFFFGLGMPLFNFYAPLTYYLGEVFHLLGAGYLDSLRLLAAAAMVLSGIGAYLYARTLLSPLASLCVAVVYMYVPYHLVNLYYRGDMAEYLAATWFPFILWAMARLVQRRRFIYLFAGSVFYGALILTHNLSALIFSGFLLIYALAAILRQHAVAPSHWHDQLVNALWLAVLAVSGLALSAFFWVPALAEKSLVDFDRLLLHYSFRQYFPTPEELFSTDLIHRYGVPFAGSAVYGFRLGLLQAILLVLGLILFLWRWSRCRPALRIEVIASLLVAALSLFLIFPVSTSVWENVPLLNLTQNPWRLLAFIALPGALLAGLIVELSPERLRWLPAVVLVPLLIASSVAGLSPILSNLKEADVSPQGSLAFELTYGAIGTSGSAEYLPKWVQQRPATSAIALTGVLGEPAGPIAGATAPGMVAVQLERQAIRATYRVQAAKAGPFVPNVLSFPGWEAFLDGRRVDAAIDDPSGLIRIEVPEGEHTISLRFVDTPLRQASDLASALALLILLGLLAASLKDRATVSRPAPSPPCFAPDDTVGNHTTGKGHLAKIAIAVALVLAWFPAKSAYDAANARPVPHPFPLVMDLDHEVLIEGYDLSGVVPTAGSAVRVAPGSSFQVTIFWRSIADDATKRYKPFIRLTNSANQTWAFAASPAEYAPARAKREDAVATTLDLPIPPGTPPGAYELAVGFESLAPQRLLEVRRVQVAPLIPGDKGARISPIIVTKGAAPGATAISAASASADTTCCTPTALSAGPVNFGAKLSLLALALADGEALQSGKPGAPLPMNPTSRAWQVRAGDVVHLDLLWQAISQPGEDWRVTTRLAGADHLLWVVHDRQPADGAYPTSFWSAGELVRDQMNLAIPPETPPGQYELQLEVVSRAGPLSILDRNRTPIGPTLRIGSVILSPSASVANAKRVPVQRRIDATLWEGLAVFGYSLGRPELQPGEQLKVDIVWQATKPIERDLLFRLAILDPTGKPWASQSGRPVGDPYPTPAWRAGEILRAQHNLTLPAATPAGEATVAIEILDPAGGQSLARLTLDRLRILPRSRSFTATPSRPLAKLFDGRIRLLGFDAAGSTRQFGPERPELALGDTLILTAHWQAVAEMNTNYTVFAQLLDADGHLVAQHDAPPQGGKAPTTAWLANEVVTDEHRVPIPPDLPEGDYTLITGIYNATTGKRLPVEGGDDFVVLTPIHLVKGAKR